MTEREKNIAMIMGVVLGAGAIYYAVNSLYLQPKADLTNKLQAARKQTETNVQIMYNGDKAIGDWADLAILRDASSAEATTREVVYAAAQSCNFPITAWNSSGSRAIPHIVDFEEASYTVTAVLTTSRLGRFLDLIESQHIPVRVDAVQIVARKPGQDDLHAEFTIKSLIYTPKVTASGPKLPTVPSGTAKPAGLASTAPSQGGMEAILPVTPSYNVANAVLGSLDPGLPPGPTLEEQMKLRRQYQLEGKKLPKPGFGDNPLDAGIPPEQAMEIRRQQQLKAASEAAAAAAPTDPPLPKGMSVEEGMIWRRQQQELANKTAGSQPATSTAPGEIK